MKIAIIGTGISGLGAAYLLHKLHDVTVYEKNSYIGGHSRTIDVDLGGRKTPLDTGFIVFNNWNYPNLMGLFTHLGVAYEKSDMSFGISISGGWLEYSSSNIFAQRRNLLRPEFYGMLKDIINFNRKALALSEQKPDITLQECLNELKLGSWFQRYYILAMGAAIWSCPVDTIMQFPAKTFLRFFKNHGLLNLVERPQWYTVTGGSREYISKMTKPYEHRIKHNTAALSVTPMDGKVNVIDSKGETAQYDHVILASHADQSREILQTQDTEVKNILSGFTYQKNRIVVHKDQSFMPKSRKCWASWVYLCEDRKDNKPSVSLTYWMNNLQNLDADHPVFVTLNPDKMPKRALTIEEHTFMHPVFDKTAINAQEKIKTIQGRNNIWFCGAYQRYGFHEDGLMSAIEVSKALGAKIPWN
ncbi:MAG: NAD(P)-binding protein [Alphaproteobacteria bacterium]|nr:NAD(P)-binding protein [Alphaproteobacteria bacterium]